MSEAAFSAGDEVVPARIGGRTMLWAILDQGLNSLGMLGVTATLVAFAEPSDYGRFAFVFASVLIAASLQYGAVGIPLLVHARRAEPGRRGELVDAAMGIDIWLRLLAALVVGAGAMAVGGDGAFALAAFAFAFAYLSRETARNIAYLADDSREAARLSATAFALLVPLFGLAFWHVPSSLSALIAFALALLAALVLRGAHGLRRPRNPMRILRTYRASFSGAGWTISNAAASEVQTRLHVFMIQGARGSAEVALVEAARILWAPLTLLYSAWQRVAQPRMASLAEAGEAGAAARLAVQGIVATAVIAGLWGTAVLLAWPLVERWLYSSYGGIAPFVVGWGIYTALLLTNWCLSVHLNATGHFRLLATITAGGTVAAAALLCVVFLDLPLVAVFAAMGGAQAGMLVALAVQVAIGARAHRRGTSQ